jgi:cytochrome c oxidase subunit II
MKDIPTSILTLTAGIVVTLISLWVGQNHGLLPVQASAQAPLVDDLFNVMVTIGTALFILVEGAILLFMIKFRRRAGDDSDGLAIEGNLPLEAFWTAIPAIIVIFLGVYSSEVFENMGGFNPGDHGMMSHHHSPAMAIVAQMPMAEAETTGAETAGTGSMVAGDSSALILAQGSVMPNARYGFGATPTEKGRTADLVVDVTGMQYAWLFTYPNGVVTGELHVPVDKDVQLKITAKDVIHSFWVPQFRLKQDALPGLPTELRFVATRTGTYPVICAELCGSYHGGMKTQVIVHTPEEYEQWWASTQVAQHSDLQSALAANPATLSDPDFLAPYGAEAGISVRSLAHLDHTSIN